MKPRKSLLAVLAMACLALASIESPAQSTTAAAQSSDQSCPPKSDIWGYCLPYEFSTFVYNLFLLQTNDTAEPADVNDVYIASNYNDDPDGFYRVFLLP
ncbi:MAG: hypothetical protein J0I77_20905 [Rudaea sp.]|uniref:hypothetical protein n=1 Tax=unclassified Rudaea TaxID=2627037 RepID=UPI0010F4C5AE|nr:MULTISPECIES: hypothetical protein [unclassified Rudaea]MBN8888186.1 hypothetical protein [Rudaea sp.]MBR0345241.1 hypothetical protein [Rudaea sp.]